MIYTDDYDYERYAVFEVNHPKIKKDIAQNLDIELFNVDENGYGYYGILVDRMMGAIVVTTKNRNYDTIRMVFNGGKTLHVEGAGKEMSYPIGNTRMTLNRFLKEFFDVPHAIDLDDPDYANLICYEEDTSCRWVNVHKDTLKILFQSAFVKNEKLT